MSTDEWLREGLLELSELLSEALAIENSRKAGSRNETVSEAFTYLWEMRWELGLLAGAKPGAPRKAPAEPHLSEAENDV